MLVLTVAHMFGMLVPICAIVGSNACQRRHKPVRSGKQHRERGIRMPYNEVLAQRVRTALAAHDTVDEKKMFGGLTFMLNGHMCCGIVRDELMVRVGPDQFPDAIVQPHAREMDFTGRPMRGMI